MTGRAERLKAFVESAATRDVVVGVDDCAPWVLAWVGQERDVRIPFPRYASREAGYAVLEAEGGLVAMADALLSGIGIFPVMGEPEPGDVGVMRLAKHDVAVIFVAGGNVVSRREDKGIMYMPARHILKAWALG